MSDPYFYREYECNISCPYFRARTIRCNKLIKNGCIKEYEGCATSSSVYLTDEIPYGSIGRLVLYFRDTQKSGYLDVFLSMDNGVWIVNPVSQIPFNPTTAITLLNSGIMVSIGSVADLTWKYNGF